MRVHGGDDGAMLVVGHKEGHVLGKGDINPWMPEPEPVLHQALGKLAEEAAELAKIATRCVIQGLDECDPGSGARNRVELCKELSDVFAVMRWLQTLADIDVLDDRVEMKLEGFLRWEEMITAEEHARQGQLLATAIAQVEQARAGK